MVRKLLPILFLLCCVASVSAQVKSYNAKRLSSGTAVPTMPCTPGPPFTDVYIRKTDHSEYHCTALPNVWTKVTSGSSSAGITNSAGANVVPKSDGTNLVASRIIDDGTDIKGTNTTGKTSFGDTLEGGAAYAEVNNSVAQHYVNLQSDYQVGIGDLDQLNGGSSPWIQSRSDLQQLLLHSSEIRIDSITGLASIGDLNSFGNNTKLVVNDTSQSIAATASTESLTVDGVGHTVTVASAAKTSLNAATGVNVQGTNTNDSAASGFVGELLTAALASGSATSLTTGTAKTVISVSLTAGDWDVDGVLDYVPAATTTTSFVQQGANTTTNTLGGEGTFTSSSGGNLSGTVLGSLIAENIPTQRISLAASTTIYLVGKASFAISTMTAYGTIRARRVR